MSKKSEKLDNIVNKHMEYWKASDEYARALDELNDLDFEDSQRIRCMKTKLMADKCQIEFELNRLVEKQQ